MYHILLFSVCTCVFAGKYAVAYMWRSEDSIQELALAYLVACRDQTQLVRHSGNQVSLQSHLTGPMQKYHTQLCFYVTSQARVGLCRLFSC